jgi:hypothetical protein
MAQIMLDRYRVAVSPHVAVSPQPPQVRGITDVGYFVCLKLPRNPLSRKLPHLTRQ